MFRNYKIGLSVVNYNASSKIIELVERIIDYGTIDNIVIVDNGSTDNSLEELKTISKYKKVKLIDANFNGGWSYGQNIGCKYLKEECIADYAVIMSPANYFTEETLISLIDSLSVNKKFAVLAPVLKDIDSSKKDPKFAWERPSYIDFITQNFFIFKKYYDTLNKGNYTIPLCDEKKIIPVEVVPGSFYLIDINILCRVNYYDEDIFLYNEENVLSSKLNDIGYYEGILSNTEYFHELGYTMKKNFNETNALKFLRDSQYVYAKKYLKASNFKLFILKITQRYEIFENKIIGIIRFFIKEKT